MKKLIYILVALSIISCEDVADITLPEGPEALVVDAWINDKDEPQVITLTYSQPYFDNGDPKGVTGAEVTVVNESGNTFTFTEDINGRYIWNPADHAFAIEGIGEAYGLQVVIEGETFVSQSILRRTTPVDSIIYTFEPGEEPFQPEGYYAQFAAEDQVGEGDTYWIKSYKNGRLLNSPFDLKFAFDAGFSSNGNIDGTTFIQPIQDVNVFNEELDALVPFEVGDSLYVEIHSVTTEAYYFLEQLAIQTQRDGGFDEIFAEPLENLPTNIVNTNANSETVVVGFFNVASVAGNGKRLQ